MASAIVAEGRGIQNPVGMPTANSIAFQIGSDLHWFIRQSEYAWRQRLLESGENIIENWLRNRLAIDILDRLWALRQSQSGQLNFGRKADAFAFTLQEFQDTLPLLLRNNRNRDRRANRLSEFEDQLHSEFDTPYPGDKIQELEERLNDLYGPDNASDFHQLVAGLHRSAHSLFETSETQELCFRLGFDVIRPFDPLYLDGAIDRPHVAADGDPTQKCVLELRHLVKIARERIPELHSITFETANSCFWLRDSIRFAFQLPEERTTDGIFGLKFHLSTFRVSRIGFEPIDFSGMQSLFPVFMKLATASIAGEYVSKDALSESYNQRIPDRGDPQLRHIINRLKKKITSLALSIKAKRDYGYRLLETGIEPTVD